MIDDEQDLDGYYQAYEVTHTCGHKRTVYSPPELREKFVGGAEKKPCRACEGKLEMPWITPAAPPEDEEGKQEIIKLILDRH